MARGASPLEDGTRASARSAVAAELRTARLVLDRFDRLRTLAVRPGVPREVRTDLENEAQRVLSEADPVRLSFAQEVLGLSKPTLYKWVEDETLELIERGPDRVSLASVAEARPLALERAAMSRSAIVESVKPLLAEQAVPARTAAKWAELGALRLRKGKNGLTLPRPEREYLRAHLHLLFMISTLLSTEADIKGAVLFGSAARGDEHPDSDVDLLIDADWEVADRFAQKLQDKLQRPVDTVTFDSALEQPALLQPILEEGRPLLLRSDRWNHLKNWREEIAKFAATEDARIISEGRAALEAMKERAA